MAGADNVVVYHDIVNGAVESDDVPILPPKTQISSGSAEEQGEDHVQLKKRCNGTKCLLATVVICAIILGVVLSRPGALSFGKNTPSSAEKSTEEGGGNETMTPWPTYFPTYQPTVNSAPSINLTITNDTTSEGLGNETDFDFAGIFDDSNATETGDDSSVDEGDDVTDDNTTVAIVSTTVAPTTTTGVSHPVCGENVSAKVFKLQVTPSSSSASYTFTSADGKTTYSTKSAGELTVGEVYEEKVCLNEGDYWFSYSGGGSGSRPGCVKGYLRGELILSICTEGSFKITVDAVGAVASAVDGGATDKGPGKEPV